MKTAYKTVYDLTSKELNELREAYFEQPDSENIFEEIENITDDILFEHYDGVLFTDEDFFCNEINERSI